MGRAESIHARSSYGRVRSIHARYMRTGEEMLYTLIISIFVVIGRKKRESRGFIPRPFYTSEL